MDEADLKWAVRQVEEAALAAERWLTTRITQREEKDDRRREFSQRLGTSLPIMERLTPDRARIITRLTDGQAIADNLRMAVEELRVLPEVERRLGPKGPQLAAAHLHPTVWGACLSLWDSRHYRQAAITAAQAVNAQLQNKLGRRDVSERDAAAQAFSLDEPKEGQPRLRFVSIDKGSEPDTWESRHSGARFLGMGLFAGVRNVLSHGDPREEIEPDTSLEYLAAFSVLARWIDDAQRIEAEADDESAHRV